MTQIKVDTIADAAGTGATDFADGITIAGGALSALNTAEYYSSASEPTSPKNGAIWWDTTNEKVMVYIADEFKEVELGASAGGWPEDLSNVSYDSVSFDISSQLASPSSLLFSADGTRMYSTGFGQSLIYEYSLSTGFDLSTAAYNSASFNIGTQTTNPAGLAINADGTKMYVMAQSGSTVYQYSLSTPYSISTMSYDSVSFNMSSFAGTISDITFNSDGTKLYVSDRGTNAILQCTLSTAFNVGTASYDSVSFSVASQVNSCRDVKFSTDGTKMYIISSTDNYVYQYTLSSAFDISSASYSNSSFAYNTQSTNGSGIAFNSDGSKVYVVAYGNDAVYQYSTGL